MMEFDWLQFVTTASLVWITIMLLRNEKRHIRYNKVMEVQSRINKEQVELNGTVALTAKEQCRFNEATQDIFEKILHVRIETTLVNPGESGRHIN